jgi:hypothetical protein
MVLYNSNDEEVLTFDLKVRTIDSTLIAIKVPTVTSASASKAAFKFLINGQV